MLARCHTASPVGVEAQPVEVEVDLGGGLPGYHLVGLPDHPAKEGKERIRAALRHAGFTFPIGRLAINLAPATIPKRGAGFDLPLALGILVASGQLPATCLEGWALWGELAFDGRLRAPPGAVALGLALTGRNGIARLLVPRGAGAQAAAAGGLEVFEAEDLADAARLVAGGPASRVAVPAPRLAPSPRPDWSGVKDQPFLIRALTAAAAGGHGVLMMGPPGAGKTFLAERLVDLLPDLSLRQALEVAAIHGSAGLLPPDSPLGVRPPLRAPHSTATREALVGGGSPPGPGEASLAHHGVLLLDEAAEFSRAALDALRAPMQDGWVRLSRAETFVRLPARFLPVLTANPCPCGWSGSRAPCTDAPAAVRRYQSRLSGPLVDRIDIRLWVDRPDPSAGPAPDPAGLADRVLAARQRQATRLGTGRLNAEAGLDELEACFSPGLVAALGNEEGFRSRRKRLALALTLADMDGEDSPGARHLEEARRMRPGVGLAEAA